MAEGITPDLEASLQAAYEASMNDQVLVERVFFVALVEALGPLGDFTRLGLSDLAKADLHAIRTRAKELADGSGSTPKETRQ